MTFITKQHLSRRTLLQGLGTAVSLPLLDSMLPGPDSFGEDGGQSGNQTGNVLHPAWRRDGQLDPGGGRRELPALADARTRSSHSRTRWWW